MASEIGQEFDLCATRWYGMAASLLAGRWHNQFCSMKNPRKLPTNTVDTIGRGLKKIQQEQADLPLFIQADPNAAPQEKSSPEEESFRSLLHHKLSRHKAPQALRERIMKSIKSMPD